MESRMVDNIFDNRYGLTYDETVSLFEKLFKDFFHNSYSLIETINHGMAFKVAYQLEDYVFIFRSERSYIEEYSIKKDDISFDLIDYEPLLKNLEVTSNKNICFLITTLKRFIEEQKGIKTQALPDL